MLSKLIRHGIGLVALVSGVALFPGKGKTDDAPIPIDREQLSGAEEIKTTVQYGAPIAIWAVLEHGERVECLDCISYVEPLLYDKDARVREISAWWIRRRVFGYAEVALRVRDAVANDPDPVRRAAAANALGEFLDGGATPLLVKAARDADPGVRAAALSAIRRLNDPEGAPAISAALTDGDATVRNTALEAAIHVGGFSDVASVANLLSDADPHVRAKTCDALGIFKAKGSGAGLSAIARADADEEVRIAAVNALGELGDPSARNVIEAAKGDPSTRVQDAAKVASLKITGGI